MQPHHDKALVPVASEGILQLLEEHQIDLQHMHASMSAASVKQSPTTVNTKYAAAAAANASVSGSTRASRRASSSITNGSRRTSWASVSLAVAAVAAFGAAGNDALMKDDSSLKRRMHSLGFIFSVLQSA
jgi:hypothetical protein